MTVSRLRPLVLAALAFAALGCDQGRQSPSDTIVRVVNVAPRFSGLQFRRGLLPSIGNQPQDLPFKAGTQTAFDADTYNFYVDVTDLRGSATNLLTFSKEVLTGTIYTFVFVQNGTGLQVVTLEAPQPTAAATQAQVMAAHGGEGLPAMDIFLEPPGTDIAGAVPWGSMSLLGTLPARNVAPGDYQITLTAAGNRAAVLFTSTTFALTAGGATTFVITPEIGNAASAVSITASDASGGFLVDRNAPSAVRVLNAAADAAPRDATLNGQFSPPLFPAVPFGTSTDYVQIAAGAAIPVHVTPPGNPGVLELDKTIDTAAAQQYTLMFSGPTGALVSALFAEDGRRFIGEPRLVFYDAAVQFDFLDLILVGVGGDPSVSGGSIATLSPNTSSDLIRGLPGTFDLYVRHTNTTEIVAGPIPVTVVGEGVYGVLATNGPDGVTATVTLLHDFHQ
jgi:hypothetical protein